ncbi:hypothetical protein Pta02_68540 [Planobispora takensis]|uniref:Uncharacterized protein n=1 Tax=Planobispora takensis TaxID=1367882 RepID=A0A8J3T5L6_9ACTN|nr:hypothetical protein Pta02_68540 [Planobispora takensis]
MADFMRQGRGRGSRRRSRLKSLHPCDPLRPFLGGARPFPGLPGTYASTLFADPGALCPRLSLLCASTWFRSGTGEMIEHFTGLPLIIERIIKVTQNTLKALSS